MTVLLHCFAHHRSRASRRRASWWTLLLAAALALAPSGGCGAAPVECPSPFEADEPALWIAGTWDVADAEGAPVGTLVFRHRRLTTISSDGWHAGTWSLDHARWPWQLQVQIDEGEEHGVRIVLGEPRPRAFALVPIADDRILALQSNGRWALWVREVDVVPAPEPAASPVTPQVLDTEVGMEPWTYDEPEEEDMDVRGQEGSE